MSEKQIILGLSGRKSSGKTTATNFLTALNLLGIGLLKGDFTILDDGQLYISDINGDTSFAGIFDIQRQTPDMTLFLQNNLNAYFKVYNFADLLKQEVCIKILGLSWQQCYGSNEDKNTLTNLKWENMPDIDIGPYDTPVKQGQMTAREVMQYVGSNLFRKMYSNVWVDATIRRIQDEAPYMAVITDCRFPDEVEGIHQIGGKVIRLTRNPYPDDNHVSETALDNYTSFDYILDNKDMNIEQQNKAFYDWLKKEDLLPVELEELK